MNLIKILFFNLKKNYLIHKKKFVVFTWGLGIGDWAQSPIPNPQSPIPNPHVKTFHILFNYYLF
jgi:hypothetical protein